MSGSPANRPRPDRGKYKALPADRIYVADIQDKASLQKAFAGCAAAIVATSAVPKLKVWSLLPFMATGM